MWVSLFLLLAATGVSIVAYIKYKDSQAESAIFIRDILIICVVYILIVEIFIINQPTKNVYGIFKVFLLLAYSISASSIFYFISTYLPQQYVKRKILITTDRRTKLIDINITELFNILKVKMDNDNYNEVALEIDLICKSFNPDSPSNSAVYKNERISFYKYLSVFQKELLEIIQGLIVFHEYLDKEYLFELTFLEDQLIKKIIFSGVKELNINNFTYASIVMHEIYVHNNILQKINASQMEKNKDWVSKEIKLYRKKYYGE